MIKWNSQTNLKVIELQGSEKMPSLIGQVKILFGFVVVTAIVVLLVVEGWVEVDGWVDVVVGVVVVVVVVDVVVVDWVVVLSGVDGRVDVGWVDVVVVESVVLAVVSTDRVEVDATVDVAPPSPHSSADLHTLTTGSKTSAPLQLYYGNNKN